MLLKQLCDHILFNPAVWIHAPAKVILVHTFLQCLHFIELENKIKSKYSHTCDLLTWLRFDLSLVTQTSGVFLYPGAADAVHIPGNRVHRHSDHLQHDSEGEHRPAGHAHAQVLLLGGEPPGPQWSPAQRPR